MMQKEQRIQYPPRYHAVWRELFDTATDRALHDFEHGGGAAYKEPLEFLYGAEYPTNSASAMEGATYKSLAYVAHRMGMSDEDRKHWYSLAKGIPLSQAHIGIILARLDERDAMIAELETLTIS
jgi:hypothetical protein